MKLTNNRIKRLPNFTIACKSVEEMEFVLEVLSSFFPITDGVSPSQYAKAHFGRYPNVSLFESCGVFSLSANSWKREDHKNPYKFMSLGEVVEAINVVFLAKVFDPIKIQLNKEHTAIVSETTVEVGCQKFGFEAVDALTEAVKKAREFAKENS